jgi:plasmid maintenance system antidote protein VapI
MRNYSEGEVLKHLRERTQPKAGENQSSLAAKLGFSPQFINDVLNSRRNLTDALAESLGFHRVPTVYVKKRPE